MSEKKKSGIVVFIELVLYVVFFYVVFGWVEKGNLDSSATDLPLPDPVAVDTEKTSSLPPPEIEPENEAVALEKAVIALDINFETRKPLLAKERFNRNVGYLYCYTSLDGYAIPRYVTHYWKYNNRTVGQQRIEVDPNQPFVWSKMEVDPQQAGRWIVDITGDKNKTLGTVEFYLY